METPFSVRFVVYCSGFCVASLSKTKTGKGKARAFSLYGQKLALYLIVSGAVGAVRFQRARRAVSVAQLGMMSL